MYEYYDKAPTDNWGPATGVGRDYNNHTYLHFQYQNFSKEKISEKWINTDKKKCITSVGLPHKGTHYIPIREVSQFFVLPIETKLVAFFVCKSMGK